MNYIDSIKNSDLKFACAITGGGTDFISNFLREGRGSRNLEEFQVPYAMESTQDLLGALPREGYNCCSTARELAIAMYYRHNERLAGKNYIGIGVTSSLRAEGQEEGWRNSAYIAFYCKDWVFSYKVEDCYLKDLDRVGQEKFVADIIPYLLHDQEYIDKYKVKNLEEEFIYNSALLEEGGLIYSGSFNPYHDAHDAIHKFFDNRGMKMFFEICLEHFHKNPIDGIEIRNRAKQLPDKLIVTECPSFREKADFLGKPVTFICGDDVLPKITKSDKLYLAEKGCKMLVFPRLGNAVVVDEELRHELQSEVDNSWVKNSVSSTLLRNKQK